VYWSTGVNMVRLLGELFVQGSLEPDRGAKPALAVVYEHVRVSPPFLETAGEHVMTQGGPLHVHRDFFGADEAVTDYLPGREEWVATLIVTAADRRAAWARRCRVLAEIQERFGLDACLDPSPDDGRHQGEACA
jgi:pyrrolysine biosynthesis protein PylC